MEFLFFTPPTTFKFPKVISELIGGPDKLVPILLSIFSKRLRSLIL